MGNRETTRTESTLLADGEAAALHVYKLMFDDNAAPCTHGDISTLAICKPRIRRRARPGDTVAGVAGKTLAEAAGVPMQPSVARWFKRSCH
eukprot:COSAG02_NODE_9038_length_2353_cov_1.792369_1_plen_91_part_00